MPATHMGLDMGKRPNLLLQWDVDGFHTSVAFDNLDMALPSFYIWRFGDMLGIHSSDF